jgi:hypothetical protein
MSTTSKSKILSTKKKEYGMYKDKKPVKKDIRGKGKIFIDVTKDKTVVQKDTEDNGMMEVTIEDKVKDKCQVEESMINVVEELSEYSTRKRDSVVEELAKGKAVSFAELHEDMERKEEDRVRTLNLNNLISQTNRKMALMTMMEEKEEMENNINLKMEWDDMKKKSKMLTDYLEMKKSLIMVESFMSAVVKEEMVNMRNKEFESRITSKKVMSDEMFQNHEKMEILTSNPKNCSCHNCKLNLILYGNRKKGHQLTTMKKCMLTEELQMEVLADDDKFSLFSSSKKNNSKHITLMEKKNNKTVMDMKLTEIKDNLWEVDEYDFSIGMLVNLYNMGMEKNISVTYSSYMLVSWIRLMDLDMSKTMLVSEDDKRSNSEYMEEALPNSSCFSRVMKNFLGELMPTLEENEVFYSMAELPEWLEMKLIMMMGKHHVYVRYTSKEDMTNHISVRRFKGAIKIKGYILSTPMFRNIKWFMDEDSPDFLTWKEKFSSVKEKTVMSMLVNLWVKYRKSNKTPIENYMWKIALNFRDYDDMIDKIYNIEMKELDNFYNSQTMRLNAMKEKFKEQFDSMMEQDMFYQLDAGFLSACFDLNTEVFNNHSKYTVLGFKSDMFKEYLNDIMRYNSFFWNTMLLFDSFTSIKDCIDSFGFHSTVSSYIAAMDKSMYVLHEISFKAIDMIDEQEYEDVEMWKRKPPVGLVNKVEILTIDNEMKDEMMAPSCENYEYTDDAEEGF